MSNNLGDSMTFHAALPGDQTLCFSNSVLAAHTHKSSFYAQTDEILVGFGRVDLSQTNCL